MMYAYVKIPANNMVFVRLTKKAFEAPVTEETKASLDLISSDLSGMKFKYTCPKGYEHVFTVNLGKYHADAGNDEYPDSSNCAEGAYLLKPAKDERFQYNFFPTNTSSIVENTQQTGSLLNQFSFTLHNAATDEHAEVLISHAPRFSHLIEVEVMLNGISIADGNGKDAMVNFQLDNMDAKQKFFTDSNGLEMQERVIGYRPTWNFSSPT